MATLETFKGTKAQVHTALTSELIGTNTVVTITDDAYTLTDLLGIISKVGQNKVILEKAASTPIEGTATELKDMLAGVSSYTGDLKADATVSAADLNTIAKGTTGKVTATLDVATPLTKATVDALADVKATDVIAFEPTAKTADAAILVAINKIISGADFAAVATITAAAADVALVKEALTYDLADKPAVTITGAISAADVNAIAKATEGKVTATIADGTVAATLKAIKDVDGDDVITFKTTDTTVKATELKALVAKVDYFDASSIKTITAAAADVAADVAAAAALAPTANVTITGSISAANASLIAKETTGVLTATITVDTAANLLGALGDTNTSDILALTVNDTALVAASTTALVSLLEKTGGKIKVNSGTVEGSIEDLTSIYVTNKAKFEGLGNEAVTISGGGVSAAQLNAIAAATTGKVTATNIEADTAAALVASLKDAKATDALTLTVNGESAKASDLLALDGKTSKKVGADEVETITGTVADLKKVFTAADSNGGNNTIELASNVAVSVSGTVKASDLKDVLGGTTGAVTATVAADTAAKLKEALVNAADTDVLNLTVNGAKADAGDLANLLTKTTEKITVTAKEISGSLADIKTVLVGSADKFTGLDKVAVKIIGNVDAASLDAILAATSGIVTATVSGTAVALVDALENAKANDALKLTVTGTANAADLLALDAKVSATIDAQAATKIDGSAADVKKLLASKGVSLAKNVAIEIVQDTEVSAADVNAIAKATGGIVTATVAAGTAAALNKALGNATKNDAITLEVSGKTATAADLLALDGKTSVEVGATGVETITGTVADLKKVFAAKTASTLELADEVAVSVSGTVKASDLNAVLTAAGGIVTATVAAEKASVLVGALTGKNADDALKVTITDTKVDAALLLDLDGATSIAVNAASVNTITGKAEDVFAAYEANADKGISGLGNEAVDLTGATDANAELVSAINDFTTGLIKLPTVTFDDVATTFSLSDLGDLKGITGLANINAGNGENDTISISLKDLLAANDSKDDFTFKVTGDNGRTDAVKITNDLSGWTQKVESATEHTYTNGKTGQVVTIELADAVFAV